MMEPPQRPADTPKRAGVYCRLSYAPDGSLEKVERQEGDCRELACRLGWTISEAHVFLDNSRSAWRRDRKRPGWDALLDAVEAGDIDGIICYHGDRLMRQPYDLEKLIAAAERRGLRIASVSGTRDLDSADDRFILRIEVAQACRESDNTSRRVLRGNAARVAKGLGTMGGYRPFGYGVPTGVVNARTDKATGEEIHVPAVDTTKQVPEEAAVIAEAVERMLSGQSQSGVIRWMNEPGMPPTTQGGPWTEKTLRALLIRPRIAGLIEHEGTLHKAVWEPIITPEAWEDIKALYQRNTDMHPYPGRGRRNLLTKVAECGRGCGTLSAKIMKGQRGKPLRAYYCQECGKISRAADHLDAYVTGRVLAVLNDPAFIKMVHADTGDGPGVGAQIVSLEQRRTATEEQLKNLADNPDVDVALGLAALASFDRKIAELRNQLAVGAKARRLARMAGMTLEQWGDEPIEVRSATVRDLLRVVVLPVKRKGPGFDTECIEIHRKHWSPGTQ
jgi:DNA invertase Pin-like site-specific DNA recombinase